MDKVEMDIAEHAAANGTMSRFGGVVHVNGVAYRARAVTISGEATLQAPRVKRGGFGAAARKIEAMLSLRPHAR